MLHCQSRISIILNVFMLKNNNSLLIYETLSKPENLVKYRYNLPKNRCTCTLCTYTTFHLTKEWLIGETSIHSYRLIVIFNLLFVLFLICKPISFKISGFICWTCKELLNVEQNSDSFSLNSLKELIPEANSFLSVTFSRRNLEWHVPRQFWTISSFILLNTNNINQFWTRPYMPYQSIKVLSRTKWFPTLHH